MNSNLLASFPILRVTIDSTNNFDYHLTILVKNKCRHYILMPALAFLIYKAMFVLELINSAIMKKYSNDTRKKGDYKAHYFFHNLILFARETFIEPCEIFVFIWLIHIDQKILVILW